MGSHDDQSTTEVMKRPSRAEIEEDACRRWLLGILGDLSDEAGDPLSTPADPPSTPSGETPGQR